MTDNQNTEISVQTLGDAVRDRVKKAIFDSIPDIAIDSLIKKELETFTNNRRSIYENGSIVDRTDLEILIVKEIKDYLSNRIKEDVTKYLDETYQSNAKELTSAAIKELAPIFMAGMMESFASHAVRDLRNALQSKGFYI